MNTVNNIQRNIYSKRPENYCETVKIIKAETKIDILFNNHIFLKKYPGFFKHFLKLFTYMFLFIFKIGFLVLLKFDFLTFVVFISNNS